MNDNEPPRIIVTPEGAIHRYAAAWKDGDVAGIVGCYAEGVVTHYGGRSSFAGTHVGRDRLVEVLLATKVLGQRELVSIDQVHDDGETGALFVSEQFTVDGETRTVSRAFRYRTNGEQIIECWLYDQDQYVVDQAWTAQSPSLTSVTA